jgi:hypothetical protein
VVDLAWEPEAPDQPESRPASPLDTLWSLLLGGLTSAEVLAFGLVAVSAVAALWGTNVVQPQGLITEGWLRALWAAVLLGVLRPATWLPYLGVFAGARRLAAGVAPEASERARNAGAHVVTIAVLGGASLVAIVAVPGAGRFLASAFGFLSGAIGVDDLGRSLGSWALGPVVWIALVAVFIRPFVPPVHPDLSPVVSPLLGFPPGSRGHIDRVLVWAAGGVAVVLFGVALIAG